MLKCALLRTLPNVSTALQTGSEQVWEGLQASILIIFKMDDSHPNFPWHKFGFEENFFKKARHFLSVNQTSTNNLTANILTGGSENRSNICYVLKNNPLYMWNIKLPLPNQFQLSSMVALEQWDITVKFGFLCCLSILFLPGYDSLWIQQAWLAIQKSTVLQQFCWPGNNWYWSNNTKMICQ